MTKTTLITTSVLCILLGCKGNGSTNATPDTDSIVAQTETPAPAPTQDIAQPTTDDIKQAARSILNTVGENFVTQTPSVLTTDFQQLQQRVAQTEEKYGEGEPLAPWPEWGLDVDYRTFAITGVTPHPDGTALVRIEHKNDYGSLRLGLSLKQEASRWLVDDYIYYDESGEASSARKNYLKFLDEYK